MACGTLDALWECHVDRMAGYGFTRLLYAFTRARVGGSLGPLGEALILTTHSDAYVSRFVREGLLVDAPMTRWCMTHTGACSWRWVQDQDRDGTLRETERKVLNFNRQHGLVAGYTISFPDSSTRTKAAMSLGARPGLSQDDVDGLWEQAGREIAAMNDVFHLRAATLPQTVAKQPLTRRQREVLERVADGHGTASVAAALGITQGTVEKHLRLARDALGAETTAQAVLKAGYQNRIFVAD